MHVGDDGSTATDTINTAYGHSPSVSVVYGCDGSYLGQERGWDGLTLWVDEYNDVIGYMYWSGISAETAAGITVGDSWSDLSSAYPDLTEEYNFGDNISWAWISSDSTNIFGPGIRGYLSSTPDGGPIEGFFCPLPSLDTLHVGSIMGGTAYEHFYC